MTKISDVKVAAPQVLFINIPANAFASNFCSTLKDVRYRLRATVCAKWCCLKA